MSDAARLREAMEDCQTILAAFIGVPSAALDDDSPILSEFDPDKRELVMVRRDECPEILWRAAVMALDFLSIGVGFTDPDAPASGESVEAQAAALLRVKDTL